MLSKLDERGTYFHLIEPFSTIPIQQYTLQCKLVHFNFSGWLSSMQPLQSSSLSAVRQSPTLLFPALMSTSTSCHQKQYNPRLGYAKFLLVQLPEDWNLFRLTCSVLQLPIFLGAVKRLHSEIHLIQIIQTYIQLVHQNKNRELWYSDCTHLVYRSYIVPIHSTCVPGLIQAAYAVVEYSLQAVPRCVCR